MRKHYRSVGFAVTDPLAEAELYHRAIRDGAGSPRIDGSRWARLSDRASGAFLDVVVEPGGLVRHARPSFLAPAPQRVRVTITGLLPDGTEPDADLVQVAVRGTSYPLAVSFEGGSDAVAVLPFDGSEVDLELIGFADTVECYADEAAYLASGMPLPPRAVLASGLSGPSTAPASTASRALTLVSGVVLACRRQANELGGGSFLHLVIETSGMTFDAVAAVDAVEGVPPEAGCVVAAWMTFRARRPVLVGAEVAAGTQVAAGPRARWFSRRP